MVESRMERELIWTENQLKIARQQVKLLRDELKYIDWCISNRPVISERIRAVLAATEATSTPTDI